MRKKQGSEGVGMAREWRGGRKGILRRLGRTQALPAVQQQVWEVEG